MISGISQLNLAAYRIAGFYQTNGKQLASNLVRLSSGKKFNKPSDSATDYFRSQKIQMDIRGYGEVRRNLGGAIAMMDVLERAGTYLFDDLTRMKELVGLYYDDSASDEEKAAYEAEFNTFISRVSGIIDSTYYDGRKVIQDTTATSPLRSINLDPNNISSTFDIDFNSSQVVEAADINLLDITVGEAAAESAVQTQLDKAGAYLGRVSGYIYGLNSQFNLVENKVENYEKADSNISDIDTAKEMANMVKKSICQQSSIAMLGQANMLKQSVLALFM